jgi:hypothetical protein
MVMCTSLTSLIALGPTFRTLTNPRRALVAEREPFAFCFRKTTVARRMGKMFKALGLLPDDAVKEVSASDLITGYTGQAGAMTRDVMTEARGGVLFIDEVCHCPHSSRVNAPSVRASKPLVSEH